MYNGVEQSTPLCIFYAFIVSVLCVLLAGFQFLRRRNVDHTDSFVDVLYALAA